MTCFLQSRWSTDREIHSDVTLSLEDGAMTARLDFTGVKPAGFAPLDQRFWVLAGLDIRLDELERTVDFRDLTVAYAGELPAATGVTGGGFDALGFDLDVRPGQFDGVFIESGKFLISGLDGHDAAIPASTRLAGPVAAVFATLESPPLDPGVLPVSRAPHTRGALEIPDEDGEDIGPSRR